MSVSVALPLGGYPHATRTPLPQMMSMLPGFNSDLLPKGNDKQSQMMIRRYITIIESMTDKEMDTTNIKILQEPSRINRLARGSGSSPQQVRPEQIKVRKDPMGNRQQLSERRSEPRAGAGARGRGVVGSWGTGRSGHTHGGTPLCVAPRPVEHSDTPWGHGPGALEAQCLRSIPWPLAARAPCCTAHMPGACGTAAVKTAPSCTPVGATR